MLKDILCSWNVFLNCLQTYWESYYLYTGLLTCITMNEKLYSESSDIKYESILFLERKKRVVYLSIY